MKKFIFSSIIIAILIISAAIPVYAQEINLNEAIQNAATELSAGIERNSRIAILAVQSDSADFSNHILNEMITAFTNLNRFTVTTKERLNEQLNNQQFGSSAVDNITVQTLGRHIGVRYIVIGSITYNQQTQACHFFARIVDVNTAVTQKVYEADIKNNDGAINQLIVSIDQTQPLQRQRAIRYGFNNWLSFEWGMPLIYNHIGLRYERKINDFFHFGGNIFYMGFNYYDAVSTEFAISATARLYPGKRNIFFLGLDLGYGYSSYSTDAESSTVSSSNMSGIMITPTLGFRIGGYKVPFYMEIYGAFPFIFLGSYSATYRRFYHDDYDYNGFYDEDKSRYMPILWNVGRITAGWSW